MAATDPTPSPTPLSTPPAPDQDQDAPTTSTNQQLGDDLYQAALQFEFDLKMKESFELLRQSDELGLNHAPTQFKLAVMHVVDGNIDEAFRYHQLAADQDHGEAAAHIALFHLAGVCVPQSAEKAYSILHQRVEAGCSASMFHLFQIYTLGIKQALNEAHLLPFTPHQDLSDSDLVAVLNPDNIRFAENYEHAVKLLCNSAQGGFPVAIQHYLQIMAGDPEQVAPVAARAINVNPLEKFNQDKAHGTNAQIDDALDYLYGTNGRPVDYIQARLLLESASKRGYGKAYYILGLVLRHAPDPNLDQVNRIALSDLSFVQAAVRGCPNAQFQLGHWFLTSGENLRLAGDWLHLAAYQDHTEATYFLARMYQHGLHSATDVQNSPEVFRKAADVQKAAGLYQKAAQAGHLGSQLDLLSLKDDDLASSGMVPCLIKMATTPFDPTDNVAKLLDPQLRLDHQQEASAAHYSLAKMYEHGKGVSRNIPKARTHMIAAAEGGNLEAQVELGKKLLHLGEDFLPTTTRDNTVAIKWLTMAANQNHSDSQLALARVFSRGLGVKADIATAAEWYRKAADNGEAVAQWDLGQLHYRAPFPHIIPKDTAKGIALMTSAAEQGLPDAQLYLGQLSEKARDYHSAEKWYTAASKGPSQGGEGKSRLAEFYFRTPEYLPPSTSEKQLDLRILSLYASGAKNGSLTAKLGLGLVFARGFRSIQRDRSKAIKFLVECVNDDPKILVEPAASTTQACALLGVLDPGCKTVLGFTTMIEWIAFGAKHGGEICQHLLADCYYEGKHGVKQDYPLASFWVDKSFRQGNQDAAALVGKMQFRRVFVRPPESDEEDE